MNQMRTALSLAVFAFSCGARAETVTLTAAADATLHELVTTPLANGAGDYVFCGNTSAGDARRALIRFDLASIPAGSTVTDATLTMRLSRTISGNQGCNLHRVTSDWTEGPADPGGDEGRGAPATAGDATWEFSTYDTVAWNTPGGDYDATSSATASVGLTLADYEWSSAALAADVQAWVNGDAPNYGWIVIGNEGAFATAKRFNSGDNAIAPPRLTVTFDAPAACPCELDGMTAAVDVFDLLAYLDLWFAGDTAAELDGAAGVDVFDLLAFLDCWFAASAGGPCR